MSPLGVWIKHVDNNNSMPAAHKQNFVVKYRYEKFTVSTRVDISRMLYRTVVK